MKLQHKFGLLLSSLSLFSFISSAEAEPKVVTSIKPIHSLVSYVMDGVGRPDLLVDGSSYYIGNANDWDLIVKDAFEGERGKNFIGTYKKVLEAQEFLG